MEQEILTPSSSKSSTGLAGRLPKPLIVGGIIAVITLGATAVAILVANRSSTSDTNSNTSSSSSTTSAPTSSSSIPAGWQQLCDSLTGVCFALPPQESYTPIARASTKVDQSAAKQWYFDSRTIDEGGHYFSDKGYKFLSIVRSPGRVHLSQFACDGYCAGQSSVSVSILEDTQTLDQAMTRYEDTIKVGFDVLTSAPLKITNKQKIEKWGYTAYQFNIVGGASSAAGEVYYLMSTGDKLIYVSMQTETRDADSTAVLDSLVMNQ